MKAKELRDLTPEEILKRKKELKEEAFNLRFQHSTQPVPEEGEGGSRVRVRAQRCICRSATLLNLCHS